MSVAFVYTCDGPECGTWVRSVDPPPREGWFRVEEGSPVPNPFRDFCSWECVIRYGAGMPQLEVHVPPTTENGW